MTSLEIFSLFGPSLRGSEIEGIASYVAVQINCSHYRMRAAYEDGRFANARPIVLSNN